MRWTPSVPTAESTPQGQSINQERQRERSWEKPAAATTVDRVSKFQNDPLMAGRLKHCSKNWEKYTSDKEILDTVNGMRIKVFDNKPSQMYKPHELALSTKECEAICNEIDRLLSIGVIVPSQSEPYQFIATIFCKTQKGWEIQNDFKFRKTK